MLALCLFLLIHNPYSDPSNNLWFLEVTIGHGPLRKPHLNELEVFVTRPWYLESRKSSQNLESRRISIMDYKIKQKVKYQFVPFIVKRLIEMF